MELLLILLIPIFTAILSLIPAKQPKFVPVVTIFGTFAVFVLSLHVAMELSPEKGSKLIGITGWISCDGLSALILLLVSFVGFTAAVFSWGYMENKNQGNNSGNRIYRKTHNSDKKRRNDRSPTNSVNASCNSHKQAK